MNQLATNLPPIDDNAGEAVARIIDQNKPDAAVAIYNPFRQQLAEIKNHNAKLVFDYADPEGNKEARSHVYKLRQTKAAIDKARKAEKAASLEYGRKVDAEAAKLTEEIEEMIEVHAKPLEEQEAKEKARIDGIMATINGMTVTAESVINKTSTQLLVRLTEITDIAIDNSFGEFLDQAKAARSIAVEYLTGAINLAEQRELDEAELTKLREEAEQRRLRDEEDARAAAAAQEEKDRNDREKQEQARRDDEARSAESRRIAAEKDAADKAAEAEKRRVANEAAERERLLKEQSERAEREKQALIDKAEQDRKDAEKRQQEAVKAERDRIQRELNQKTVDDAKREADKEHRRKIHQEIVAGVMKASGVTTEQAQAIVVGICGDIVPHVKILY